MLLLQSVKVIKQRVQFSKQDVYNALRDVAMKKFPNIGMPLTLPDDMYCDDENPKEFCDIEFEVYVK